MYSNASTIVITVLLTLLIAAVLAFWFLRDFVAAWLRRELAAQTTRTDADLRVPTGPERWGGPVGAALPAGNEGSQESDQVEGPLVDHLKHMAPTLLDVFGVLAPPAGAVSALQRAAEVPAMQRYGFGLGLVRYREAIAAWMHTRFGQRVDPITGVVPLLGSKEGLAHIAFAFARSFWRWSHASWPRRQSTEKRIPWKPLEMIFVTSPRKNRPDTPSLAITIETASPYPIGVVLDWTVVLSTRTEFEIVSETALLQKPTTALRARYMGNSFLRSYLGR